MRCDTPVAAVCGVGMALVMIMKVLRPHAHHEGPCPVPSSPTYTVVDHFDENEFPDIPAAPAALLAALKAVPDPRKPRGLRHQLPGILAIAACAVMAGARSFVAIAEWSAAATPAELTRLGITGEPPCESTIRRTISKVDANGLDLILGAWTAQRAGMPEELRVIAVDGKSLRGSATAGDGCRHLLAALTHVSGMVLGQLDVDLKTNEIPMFSTLLDSVELHGSLVTADPLHCQKEHAKYLVEQRGAHYLLTVKGNQPTLREQLATVPWADVPIADTQHDRGHGRVEKRTLKVVTIPAGIGFPHAAQAIQVTYHHGVFLCRAVSQDIATVTVSLKELEAARNQRRWRSQVPTTRVRPTGRDDR